MKPSLNACGKTTLKPSFINRVVQLFFAMASKSSLSSVGGSSAPHIVYRKVYKKLRDGNRIKYPITSSKNKLGIKVKEVIRYETSKAIITCYKVIV